MRRSGISLAWLLTSVTLAGYACTSDVTKALPQESNSETSATGNLVLHRNGTTVDLLDSEYADEINQKINRLIESCAAQLKKRVSGGDWQAARLAPYSVESRSASNTAINLNKGDSFNNQAAIITINEDLPSHTSVLTLVDNQYRSPFVLCSAQHTIALTDLVNNAMHLR
ncbi:MAG: hypothetical protein AB8B63_06335 [Granulosicoccus sp.]